MFIIDAHQDIAYNAICFKRDYRLSALKKRRLEHGTHNNGDATLGLPEAMIGRVALVFASIFVQPYTRQATCSGIVYRDADEAHIAGMRQLDYYNRIVDEDERLILIHNAGDLETVLATWAEGTSITERKQGLILMMEGADPIIEPQQFEEWYEHGVRIVGPAWVATRYAGGTGYPGPLTSLGYELLEVMMDMPAILDLSHLAEQAYWEALDIYEGPIIASHSNPRQFCNTDRHLSDAMIRRLAERDGVIGIVLYNYFLDDRWHPSDGKSAISITRVVAAVDHVCQVTGSVAHVGIGSDFDGGFGRESIPQEFDTVADLWQLKDALEQRGFSGEDVAAILGGNMLRKLRQSLES